MNQGKYASVKSCIEDTLFECELKDGDVQMLVLNPIDEQDYSSEELNVWTNTVNINVKCILSQDK